MTSSSFLGDGAKITGMVCILTPMTRKPGLRTRGSKSLLLDLLGWPLEACNVLQLDQLLQLREEGLRLSLRISAT